MIIDINRLCSSIERSKNVKGKIYNKKEIVLLGFTGIENTISLLSLFGHQIAK